MSGKDHWPSYDVGFEEHAQAIGILSNNYNNLETELLDLLKMYDGAPEEVVALLFEKLNADVKVDWMRRLVRSRKSTEPRVSKALLDFCSAYSVCTKNRNLIVHSRVSALWTGTGGGLLIAKRGKNHGKDQLRDIDLETIRRVADEIYDWGAFVHHVAFYVKRRNRSRLKQYKKMGVRLYGPTTLPKTPSPPKDLEGKPQS
jgi:hypothetical protein